MEGANLSLQELDRIGRLLGDVSNTQIDDDDKASKLQSGHDIADQLHTRSLFEQFPKASASAANQLTSPEQQNFATFEDILLALTASAATASASTFATDDSIALDNELLFTPLLSPAVNSPLTSYTPYYGAQYSQPPSTDRKATTPTIPYDIKDYDVTPLSSPAFPATQYASVRNAQPSNGASKSSGSSPSIGQAINSYSIHGAARKRTLNADESVTRPIKARPSPVLKASVPNTSSKINPEMPVKIPPLPKMHPLKVNGPTSTMPPPKSRVVSANVNESSSVPLTPSSLMSLGDASERLAALSSVHNHGDQAGKTSERYETPAMKKSASATSVRQSPSLQPILPNTHSVDAHERLRNKSNYENILDGRGPDLGLGNSPDLTLGLHSRKTNHKAAEQKRRDCMKGMFEELRSVLPEEWGGGNAGTSKVMLLEKAHDYVVLMRHVIAERDDTIDQLRSQISSQEVASSSTQTARDLRPREVEGLLDQHHVLQNAQKIAEGSYDLFEPPEEPRGLENASSTSPLELNENL